MNLQARLSVQEGKNRESLLPGRTLEFCAGEFKPASFKAGRTLPHYFTYDRIISGESHLRLLHLSCSRGSGVAEQDLFFHFIERAGDRKSTRLNSSHVEISYAVFCLKK